MSVIDLVARLSTESCRTSIRLWMCQEKHYDNTQFLQKKRAHLCGAKNVADQRRFSKYTFMKTKENAL